MASDTNTWLGTGRLTADPDIRTVKNGLLTTFRIAVNRWLPGRDGEDGREETSFMPVATWGNLASRLGDQLQRGSLILVEGRLDTREWTDEAGTRQFGFEINAHRVQLLRGGRTHEEV